MSTKIKTTEDPKTTEATKTKSAERKGLISMDYMEIAVGHQFKNKKLETATRQIIAIVTDAVSYADKKNREIASILSKVKNEKSYEDDGYKSVADYAEQIFGIKKQSAYSLAAAGDVYNDEKAPEKLKQFSPYNLAAISSVKREDVEADIESGKISPTTSQKDLKDYAKQRSSTPKKAEVVPEFVISPMSAMTDYDQSLKDFFKNVNHGAEDELNTAVIDILLVLAKSSNRDDVEVIRLPNTVDFINGKPTKKKNVLRKLYIIGQFSMVVKFSPYFKKAEKQAPKFTEEELLKMLEDLRKGNGNV